MINEIGKAGGKVRINGMFHLPSPSAVEAPIRSIHPTVRRRNHWVALRIALESGSCPISNLVISVPRILGASL